MSAIPYSDDVLDSSVSLFQLADVSKNLGLPLAKVHQLLRDRKIIAVKRRGVLGVPELFFDADGSIVKWLPGLLAVLGDGGYTDVETLRWLFRADESLPGRPVDALHGDLAREIIRRAQAMAF
ncbi:Rv2175c family DNA-binding protein [Rhodococcus sp. 27YEA15]|uniref:Rv2175c family DNA-binding protein n=1 Tax=Rhodococcus sp. 27YEA15 TaxID=3156259 RepID=UPI003C7E6B82